MTNTKRAFTLIELLVVIAIIAILAAILFPVFAQAKLAAKGIASLSNTKQLDLAALMYQNDYDDAFPIGTSWETTGSQAGLGWPSTHTYFSTWGWQIAPYVKTAGLFQDPTATPSPNDTPAINFDTLYTQYGYNYTFLSPYVGPGSAFAPTSQTSSQGAQLSNTVMLTSKWVFADNTSTSAGLLWGTGFPTNVGNAWTGSQGMLADAGSESPDCDYISYWCLTDWGAGGFYDNTGGVAGATTAKEPFPSLIDGRLTGGNAYRVANKVTVSWCDGHAKTVTNTGLAQGTTFNINAAAGAVGAAGAIDVTNMSQYLWSLSKSCGLDFPAGEVDSVSGRPACTQGS